MTKSNKAYNSWISFKRHVKNGKYSFCEDFKDFKNYCRWYVNNPNFHKSNWVLYRKLFEKHTTLLSPDTLCFLPKEIIYCLNKCEKSRGEYPLGVSYCKKNNAFVAHMSFGKNKSEFLGCFSDVSSAFNAYKTHKEQYIKKLAGFYVNELDAKVYNALITYNIEITD